MPFSRKSAWSLSVLGILLVTRLSAQQLEVTRDVNLRVDPSTSQDAIRLLHPPEVLDLIDPAPTSGYFHVHTTAGEEGWVWKKNVRLQTAPTLTPTPESVGSPTATVTSPPSPTPTPTVSGVPSISIDETWQKPALDDENFAGHGQTCGPSGQGGDSPTNLRKNRIDEPSNYHEVTFDTVALLPYPADKPNRSQWTAAHLTEIARYEGVAISVTAYLSHKINVEGAESTNCGWTAPAEVDWHMYLTKQPQQPISSSVVIETTPRVRASHPHWTTAALAGWVEQADPSRQVRISGWLMLDPLHADQVGSARETIWEIHPVTKIEVWQGGSWVDLDLTP